MHHNAFVTTVEPDANFCGSDQKNGGLLVRGRINFDDEAEAGEPIKPINRVFNGRIVAAYNDEGLTNLLEEWDRPHVNAETLRDIRQFVTSAGGSYYHPSDDLYGIDDDRNVTAFCWTPLHYCADTSEIDLTHVREVVDGGHAFTALKTNGSLVSWGWFERAFSRGSPYTNENVKLLSDHGEIFDVVEVVGNDSSSFAALRSNHHVITWGYSKGGGSPSGVNLTNVESLHATSYSFAARKFDGPVVIWRETGKLVADNVKTVVANDSYYATIKMDGTVGYWDGDGNDIYEDLIEYKYDESYEIVGSTLPPVDAVKEIIAGRYTFSAWKEDGTVYSLGNDNDGDYVISNIIKIFKPSGDTYAGLDAKGNLRVWGNLEYVGNMPEEDFTPTLIETFSTLN